MRTLSLALALLAVQGADKAQVVQGTTGARSESLEIHAGGVVVRESEVGSAFGTFQIGKGKPQLSYFVLFKHHLSAETPLEPSEETLAEGDAGTSKQVLTIGGKSLVVEYQLRLDAKKLVETLTVNKKALDLAKGRLLLVDLTATAPRVEQRRAALPNDVGDVTSKKAAEELVRQVLALATRKDRKVRDFVEAARR